MARCCSFVLLDSHCELLLWEVRLSCSRQSAFVCLTCVPDSLSRSAFWLFVILMYSQMGSICLDWFLWHYLSAKRVFLSTVVCWGTCNTLWVVLLKLGAKMALVLPLYCEECFEILIQKKKKYNLVLNSQIWRTSKSSYLCD